MTAKVGAANTRANISKLFALFDDEKTGYISIKNLRRAAKDLNENIEEQQLQEMISRADGDGDGLVA